MDGTYPHLPPHLPPPPPPTCPPTPPPPHMPTTPYHRCTSTPHYTHPLRCYHRYHTTTHYPTTTASSSLSDGRKCKPVSFYSSITLAAYSLANIVAVLVGYYLCWLHTHLTQDTRLHFTHAFVATLRLPTFATHLDVYCVHALRLHTHTCAVMVFVIYEHGAFSLRTTPHAHLHALPSRTLPCTYTLTRFT